MAPANVNGFEVAGIVTAASFSGSGSGLTGVAATDNIITTKEAKLLGGVRMEGFTTSATMNVTGVSTFRGDISLIGSAAGVSSVTWDASARSLKFSDNAYAQFGDAQDLSIYHDASNSIIDDSGSGSLKIQTDGTGVDIQKGSSETLAKFIVDGSVELYENNVKRLETATDDQGGGVIVTGKIVGTAATIGTGVTINNTGIDIGIGGIGIVTSGTLVSGVATIGTGVTITNTGIDAGIGAGIVTASSFVGDLTGAASQITVADESTDTSCNVVFTTAATGDLAPKTGTNLTFNSSSGALTATSFSGDGSALTGLSAGGSGEFNTSISGATQYDVTTSMATAYTANASSSHRTIVHSIHICNISASDTTISGEIQSSFSLAHTIPVPAGSAVELLKQPKVLGPSETIELQAGANSALEATIIVEYKEDTDYWDAAVDITSAATMTDIYTSSSNPSVVQSILLANDDGNYDVKARVAWTDGSNTVQSYLCYDMIIPADSTVELCEKPKYLASGYKLRGYGNIGGRLEITASGKQIT